MSKGEEALERQRERVVYLRRMIGMEKDVREREKYKALLVQAQHRWEVLSRTTGRQA